MPNSIHDSVLQMLGPEMQKTLATRFNASPQTLQAGIAAGSATTLNTLATRTSDNAFLNQFLSLVRGATDQNIIGSVPSLVTTGLNGSAGELVNRFLSLVFGADQAEAARVVAQKSGLNEMASNSLLSTAAGLVLVHFSKLQSAGTLNASSLAGMLKAETPNLERWIPARTATAVGAVTSLGTTELGDGPGVGRTAMWFVSLAALSAALMAFIVFRATSTSNVLEEPVTYAAARAAVSSANVVSNTMDSATAAAGVIFKTKLPDGTELSIPKDGVESRLVSFLNDSSKAVDDNNWFDLDKVQFGSGNATLESTSDEQLQNLAAILKAYPNAKIRIGGYTDNSGDKAANRKTSDQEAKNAMAALEKMGVDKSRMTAQGYGGDRGIATNDTEEGRQQNRRIAILVTQK